MADSERPSESLPFALTNTGYPTNSLGAIIQSPEVTAEGKPTQRSVRDVAQARDIIRTVMTAGRNRAIVNSRILAKINAERPYNADRLEQEGLGWRSNFTTKPLPSLAEQIAPRFINAVNALKYFTNSSLSDKWLSSTEKTESFRKEVTDCIKNHKGFKTLLEDIAFNNAIFGSSIVSWLDEYAFFPRHFGQDEAFAADGTKSDPRWCQILVLKENLLTHELFDHIKDPEAATAAGWKLENTAQAINRASPVQVRDRLNVGGTLETWYQNALRELTIGASWMAGNSIVVVYNLLVREVTGKVTHYRLAGPELTEIYSREDQYDGMTDAVTFFTFQKGNGTLAGSKGIGRDLYELAGMLDRARNEVVDRLIMSGKTMVQGDIKRIHTFKMSILGNMVIVPSGWNFLEQKIDGNVDGFIKLDGYFRQLANELVGGTSTPNVAQAGEGMRSPAAWNLLASREEESRDIRITRFLEQFTDLVQTMQKRICNEDVVEPDAKETQRRLLTKMSREELDELANAPVAAAIVDLTPQQRQLTVLIAQEKKGNPLYNQRQLEVEDLTARVDSEFANRVLLPDADPTDQAEQSRMQNLEITLLSAGHPVEVSPRDNHLIHLQVLMPVVEQAGGHLQDGQISTEVLETMIAHVNEHYSYALKMGIKQDNPVLAEVKNFLAKAGPALAKLKQMDMAAQAHAQAGQQLAAGQEPDMPGAVPQPTGQPTPQQ